MNFRYILILVTGLCIGFFDSPAQLINNPSFEGVPQENIPPTHWQSCNAFSTPDTQPGYWAVTQSASHGSTYLGMVVRGNLGPYANNVEACQTRLNRPLQAGTCYRMSIDLAISDTWGHYIDFGDFLSYYAPTALRIWGGKTTCEKTELLWESPVINHTDWRTYELTLNSAINELHYLIMEAHYANSPTYFGNILVDNIVEKSVNDHINLGNDRPICKGESITLDPDVAGDSYLWSNGSTQPTITVSSAGMYWVDVTMNNCTARDSVQIFERAPISINLKDEYTFCQNDTLLLDATTPEASYRWSTGSTNGREKFTSAGTYWLEITNGCYQERKTFTLQTEDCNCVAHAANIFTPNDDGINDYFFLSSPSNVARFYLSIYDRWGKLVFETDKLNQRWDGKRNGINCSTGVYYWQATYMCTRNNQIYDSKLKGHVTLLR